MTLLLDSMWQGILVVAVMWGVLKLLPALNAATRYVCWWITLLAVVLLPLRAFVGNTETAPMTAPQVSAPLARADVIAARTNLPASSEVASAPAISQMETSPAAVSTPLTSTDGFRIHLLAKPAEITIAVLWGLASVVLLVRLVRGFLSLRRLKRSAIPMRLALHVRLGHLADVAGVRRDVSLLESDDVAVPMALGLFRPAIVMPRHFTEQLGEPDFDHIVLHELAHLRRYDDWLNLLQQVLVMLMPIQPAVFWIDRQLMLERETACDDWVIAVGKTPKHYAASLARVAELAVWRAGGILCSPAIGAPSQLYRRVQRLLDRSRNAATRLAAKPLAMVGMTVIALTLGTLRAPRLFALAEPVDAATPQPADSQPAPAAQAPADPNAVEKSFDVQPGDKLVTDIDCGNIIVSTWDQNRVQVTVTQKGSAADEYLKHRHLTIEKQEHAVVVQSRQDPNSSLHGQLEIRYQITLPRNFNVSIKNNSGNVDLSNITGKSELKLNSGNLHMQAIHGDVAGHDDSGNIKVSDCQGAVDVSTSSGNVLLSKISGSVKGHSGSGNIEAAECADAVDAKTASGNLKLTKDHGPITGHTDSGNIDVSDCDTALNASVGSGDIDVKQFAGPSIQAKTGVGNVTARLSGNLKADSALRTGSGNVTIYLPHDAALKLSASTGIGHLRSDFAGGTDMRTASSPNHDRNTIEQQLNAGGPTLRLESGVGNVQVLKQ